jgi:hypothetical protein
LGPVALRYVAGSVLIALAHAVERVPDVVSVAGYNGGEQDDGVANNAGRPRLAATASEGLSL